MFISLPWLVLMSQQHKFDTVRKDPIYLPIKLFLCATFASILPIKILYHSENLCNYLNLMNFIAPFHCEVLTCI